MPFFIRSATIVASLCLSAASLLHSQEGNVADIQANRDLARNPQAAENSQIPTAGAPYEIIPAMEGDEDFGEQVIIERVSNWYPLTVDASITGFRTNNADLADSNGQADNYLREALALSFTQNITGNFLFDFGVNQETYRYRNLSDLDFDYLRTHTGVFYRIDPGTGPLDAALGNGFLFANYAYYRVTDGLFGDEAFTNHSAVLGFQKMFPVVKGHQIYYGFSSDLSIASNDAAFQRDEHRIYAGYVVEWTEDLVTRIGYVAGLFDFREGTQTDWSHTIETSIDCVIARPTIFGKPSEAYLNGTAFYNLNDSNSAGLDYEYFNFGGGFGIRSSF